MKNGCFKNSSCFRDHFFQVLIKEFFNTCTEKEVYYKNNPKNNSQQAYEPEHFFSPGIAGFIKNNNKHKN